ncbi:MAG TPA: hypothetical protein VND99_06305 [Candidatus Acidoferrales bacterium]|nr:hypothetical protein [Candidatus Acidoferrales bacterium]
MKLFISALVFGYIFSYFPPFIHTYINFNIAAIILLVIGLYASVYEIDITILKKHTHMVLSAITFGVILKSAIIGSLFFLITRNMLSFLLGVAVAQIDPLSVSYLLKSKDGSFSTVGRTILRVWSSFDDPMTILLSIFFVAPIILGTFYRNPFTYIDEVFFNILFAFVIFVCNKFVNSEIGKKVLLFFSLFIAIICNLTLGISLIALFLRPTLGKALSSSVTIAFYIGVLLLGLTVTITLQSVLAGVLLGVIAFVAQIIATFLIAKKLTKTDKFHLAFAQYNGITSIGLGIFFQHSFPSITSIIALAVVTINSIYYLANHVLYKKITSNLL